MVEAEAKTAVYRHKAKKLRDLAQTMEWSASQAELLAEAAKWERLADAVERAEKRRNRTE